MDENRNNAYNSYETSKASQASQSRRDNQGNGAVPRYDMTISTQRLMENGFHPAVSSKKPAELQFLWLRMAESFLRRPTYSEYVAGQIDPKSFFNPKHLTNALLLFKGTMNYELALMVADDDATEGTDMLVKMLSSIDIGPAIIENIFLDGWKSVLSTAITSTRVWITMASSIKAWDFAAGKLRFDAQSGVLLAVMPEYTVDEIRDSYDADPYGLDDSNSVSGWAENAIRREREIYLSIHMVHGRLNRKSSTHRKRPHINTLPETFMASETFEAIKSLQDMKNIFRHSQFSCTGQRHVFEPQAIFAATQLRCLLNQIAEQSAGIKVLYLQKIPMLDRRLVAIILRGCPQVRMLGIYNCELIHFGDVVCLIDLIWEINSERRRKTLPEITAFDFYPSYNAGMPYQAENAATYGLTWGPEKLDVVQRGFFLLIMKAFLKAKRMKLGLLFSKDKSFMDFLARVPNYPLAVPTFLDALHRYTETRTKKKDDDWPRKEALYDLLKPVRLGLDRGLDSDWPHFYNNILGKTSIFCSSCGYETLEDFFTIFSRDVLPQNRKCSACALQKWLDEEKGQHRVHRREALNTLFPSWNGNEFNKDAPLVTESSGLLKLRSTETIRKDPKATTVDENGEMYTRNVRAALIRDGKIHSDSLRSLPALRDLLNGRAAGNNWGKFYNMCNNLDMYSRAVRLVASQSAATPHSSAQSTTLTMSGIAGTQPPRNARLGIQSHDFETALLFYDGLVRKRWAGV